MKNRWHLSKYNISAKIEQEDRWYTVNLYRGTCVPMSAAILYAMANLDELDDDTPLLFKLAKLGLITDRNEYASLEAVARMACAYPESVSLSVCPTMGCNFDCPYCFEDHRNEKMSETTADDVVSLAEKMVDKSGARVLNILWFGGEPLLAPDVIKYISERLVNICEGRNIKYNSSIITNGYLLDEKAVEMLSGCRVSKAQITLDGVGDVHDLTRHLAGGGPTFDRITDNLRNTKIPFKVAIRHNVHSDNADQQEILRRYVEDMAKESGNDITYYASPVFDNKASHDRESDVLPACGTLSSDLAIRTDASQRMKRMMGHYCMANVLRSIGIDALGRLYKCLETVDKPELSFGTVKEWDPSDPVDTASSADNLTKFLNTSGAEDDGECRECIWLPVCRGGCPYQRMIGKKQCVAYRDDPEGFVRAMYAARYKEGKDQIR